MLHRSGCRSAIRSPRRPSRATPYPTFGRVSERRGSHRSQTRTGAQQRFRSRVGEWPPRAGRHGCLVTGGPAGYAGSFLVWAGRAGSYAGGVHLGLTAIVVSEYDSAIRFFTEALGFELAEDSPALTNDGRVKRWVVVRPPGAATGLLLARADGEDQVAAVGNQVAGRVGFF